MFGGPVWNTLVAPDVAKRCQAAGTVPSLRDARSHPLKRNFVHVEDLVAAILAALDNPAARNRLYNVCMDEPVDYGALAAYLKETRGLESRVRRAGPRRAAQTMEAWTVRRRDRVRPFDARSDGLIDN
jgi:UDP-glucose 4-epimerase